MPFTDVSTVEGWEDFGFKYHEGINNIPFDDSAGILSFRYTEPSTWWMRMQEEIPRTHEGVMQSLDASLESDNAGTRRSARALQVSGTHDSQERLQYLIRDTPWCNGAVFSLNPSPHLPDDSEAQMAWNEETKQRLYGPDAKGNQDGEYLDSLEGYVTANENFRVEHFRHLTVPLTFSTSAKRPVIHKAFSVYEFTRWLAEDLHQMGKLLFANSVPHRFAFLCPWIDVMGTEMNWVHEGEWKPASDGWMNIKRTLCYQKPYLFLMNTHYDQFTPDLVEKYFQRSLFYGMYPSMFSHNASQDPYWRAPKWYNRDRHLFKRYLPLIKRIAEAGWEPITHAVSDNPMVLLERFGPDEEGNTYVTVMNNSEETQEAVIEAATQEMADVPMTGITELISQQQLDVATSDVGLTTRLQLQPEEVMLLQISTSRD